MFIFKDLKIGTKLTGSFLLLIAVSILITSFVEYRISSNAIKTQILDDLVLVADSMEGYVLEFLEGANKRVVDFSSDGFIRDSASRIISGEENVSADLNEHLIVNKKSLDSSIFGITVINREGFVIGSTNEKELGQDYSDSDYFLAARDLKYGETYLADMNVGHVHFEVDDPHLMASAPLTDKNTGEPLGVIINHVQLDPLNSVLLGTRQLELGAISGTKGRRETLEIYLVSKDKIMITESRFIEDASLKQEVDTLPVRNCENNEETSGIYPDYRGVSIVGASMCLRNGWTLLAEIDEAEAFIALVELRRNTSYVVVVLLLLSALYAVMLSRGITLPIKKLSEGVNIIGAGDYSHKVEVASGDEIGQLARSFNEMAAKIKKSHDDLNEGKERFETLLMGIGDAVFGIDREQKIVYFNRRAEEISGYKVDEVIGKQYYDVLKFVSAKDKSENIEFIRKALRGQLTTMSDSTLLIRKDKKEVDVADSASPLKDKEGNILGAIVVFRDATKEKELERAKTELVSFVGHQLKAPLTFISGNVDMLKDGNLDSKTKEFADEISLGVNKMKKLIEDVLNISRIEQGRVEIKPEPTQLEEVVDEIIKESASSAAARNLKVEFAKLSQPLPVLTLDPKLIREVFKNVISNAIKYTKDKINVSFEKKDGNIIFVCSDNGIGIPEDEKSKIFSKFFIATNASKISTEGTGLGLSYAKALIEKMNGTIRFESEEEKGTTFYVSLPLA